MQNLGCIAPRERRCVSGINFRRPGQVSAANADPGSITTGTDVARMEVPIPPKHTLRVMGPGSRPGKR